MKHTLIGIGIVAFVALEIALIHFVDRPVSEYIHKMADTNPDLIDTCWAYTDLGKSIWYLWPTAIGAIFAALALRVEGIRENWRVWTASIGEKCLFIFMAVAISGLIADAIKPILGRGRPLELIRDGFYGFRPFSTRSVWNSMPSGHSTTAFALAIALCVILPRARFLWLFLAILLAASRVIIDVHFLSDVLAGAAIGSLTTYALERAWHRRGMLHAIGRIFPIDRKNTMS